MRIILLAAGLLMAPLCMAHDSAPLLEPMLIDRAYTSLAHDHAD